MRPRLAKIREANQALEEGARARAAAAAEAKVAEKGEDEETTAERVAVAVENATEHDNATEPPRP